MTKLSELKNNISSSVLIYGSSGTSKTVFAGTAGTRTLYFDCGNSITTLQSKWFQNKFGPSDPDVHVVSEEALPNVPKALDYIVDTIEDYLKNKSDQFDTVVIDDMTRFRSFAMNQGLDLNQDLGRSNTLKNLKTRNINIVIPVIQDFGAEMALVQYFLTSHTDKLREHNKSFIVTAHEKLWQEITRDGKGNPLLDAPPTTYKITPAFTGKKYPDTETGVFDIVMHAETAGNGENMIYRSRMNGDGVIVAKNRYGDLFPTLYPNPIFTDMIKAIKEQRKINKDGKFIDGKP